MGIIVVLKHWSRRKGFTGWKIKEFLSSSLLHCLNPSHFRSIHLFTYLQSPYTSVMEPTIFHKIRDREIPADIVFEDEDVLAFKDIHPKAKTHLLFIPKQFVESIAELTPESAHLPGLLILAAQHYAKEKGIRGYKLLFNVGKEGGQEVPYLHLHLMSEQSA